MKQNLLLLLVSFTIFVSACSPSATSQSPTEAIISTSTKASDTATATRTPRHLTRTPSPDLEATNTAIVNAVMTASPPRLHGSYPSPDKQWRVEIIIYDCVQVEGSVELHAYEQLNLIEVSSGDTQEIDTQFQSCSGLGAFGLEGRFWSPNSQYFYYTYARESVPDGGCGYWERPLRRLEISSGRVEEIGMGPLSPDRTKLATWLDTDFVVWSLDEGEIARSPVTPAGAMRGPIAWSPDGGSLVYLQTDNCWFSAGTAYVVRLDLPDLAPELLLQSAEPSFIGVTWDTPNRIKLSAEDGKAWGYNFVTKELQQLP